MQDTSWTVLFADPELDPRRLLPLVAQPGDPEYRSYGIKEMLPVLWENPSKALFALACPQLGSLLEAAEAAWLKQQILLHNEKVRALVSATARERAVALLAEVMVSTKVVLHPFIHALWAGHAQWPYFHVPVGSNWPHGEWRGLFNQMVQGEGSTLEYSAFMSLAQLQYAVVNLGWCFLGAVRARALLEAPRCVHSEEIVYPALRTLRLQHATQLNLLAHVLEGVPLDYATLCDSQAI